MDELLRAVRRAFDLLESAEPLATERCKIRLQCAKAMGLLIRPAPSPADAGLVERPVRILHCTANTITVASLERFDNPEPDTDHYLVPAARIEALSGEYERGVEDAAKVADQRAKMHRELQPASLGNSRHRDAAEEAAGIAAAIRTLKAGGW